MPFALILIAAIFIVTGFKGTTGSFLSTFAADMKGFIVWIVAIGVIGAIGYVPSMKRISDAFLVLILLVMFLSNKGFFANFNQQIANPTPASATGSSGSTSLSTALPTSNQLIGALNPLPPLQGITAPSLGLSSAGSLP